MKVCGICKLEKELSDFYSDKSKKHGYRYCCKSCATNKAIKFNKSKGSDYAKDSRLKQVYGIDLEEYNRMFLEQEGKCKICGIHQSFLGRSLNIDHDHTTGKVRSLLCTKCNIGLGAFEDNLELFNLAISYLVSHKENIVK